MKSRTRVLAGLLVFGTAVVAWFAFSQPFVSEKPASGSQSRIRTAGVKVRSDLRWEEVSEQQLHEFASYFGGAKSPIGFDMEITVASGESVLVEVYESMPGEFVFTKLTPILKTKPDGTSAADVIVDSFAITVGGAHKVLLDRYTLEVTPNGSTSLGHVAYDPRTKAPNGMYGVGMAIEFVGDPPTAILLKASGDYQGAGLQAKPEDQAGTK